MKRAKLEDGHFHDCRHHFASWFMMRGGSLFASSKILEVHGERMVKRTFDPGFRIELHQKDLNLALSSARSLGVSLPNTATAQELFNACAAHGGKAWDHSAMVRALEKLANFEIGQKAAAR